MAIKFAAIHQVRAKYPDKAVWSVKAVRSTPEELKAKALAQNFTEVAPNKFVHRDGSWLAIVDGKVQRGVDQEQFSNETKGWLQLDKRTTKMKATVATIPTKHSDFSPVAVTYPHSFLVAAQLASPWAMNPVTLRTEALALGMVETRPNFFQHRDGSWVGQLDTGTIERGYQATIFPNHTFFPASHTLPPNGSTVPTSPLAKVAAVVAKQGLAKSADLLVKEGFVEQIPGQFRHPSDLSWVSDIGGKLRMGRLTQLLTPKSFIDAKTYAGMAKATDFTTVIPVDFHSSYGAVTLALPPAPDAVTLRTHALAAGLKETSPFMFTHADGSWVALFEDGTVNFGVGQTRFRSKPQDLSARQMYPAGQLPRTVSIGLLVDELVARGFEKSRGLLLENGFSQQAPNYYSHADGSWVAQVNGKLVMGGDNYYQVDATSFVPMPAPLVAGPNGFARPPAQPTDEKWAWYKDNTALGRTPIIVENEASRKLLGIIGYVKGVDALGNERWSHPDTSYVTFLGKDAYGYSKFDLGYNGWQLWQMPFNDRISTKPV